MWGRVTLRTLVLVGGLLLLVVYRHPSASPATVYALPRPASSGLAAPAVLAQIRFIHNGLTVHIPRGQTERGVVKMRLLDRYGLQTAVRQLASIGFRDGTVLHLNEHTNAVLRSPTDTFVSAGTVDEELVPGSDHQITTAAATASAIGTSFLVMIIDRGTYFMVRHGAVLVKNAYGSVVVKHNQGSLVVPGHAPQPAYPIDATAAGSWIRAIPPVQIGANLALDADGGRVVAYSSQFGGAAPDPYSNAPGQAASPATFINDGRLDRAWETAPGSTVGQSVTVKLAGDQRHRIHTVLLDPAAPAGSSPSEDLKDFSIWVSSSGMRADEFRQVVAGTCRQSNSLQRFEFLPVIARYVKLVARDNYGSPDRLAVAEMEVIGR